MGCWEPPNLVPREEGPANPTILCASERPVSHVLGLQMKAPALGKRVPGFVAFSGRTRGQLLPRQPQSSARRASQSVRSPISMAGFASIRVTRQLSVDFQRSQTGDNQIPFPEVTKALLGCPFPSDTTPGLIPYSGHAARSFLTCCPGHDPQCEPKTK